MTNEIPLHEMYSLTLDRITWVNFAFKDFFVVVVFNPHKFDRHYSLDDVFEMPTLALQFSCCFIGNFSVIYI